MFDRISRNVAIAALALLFCSSMLGCGKTGVAKADDDSLTPVKIAGRFGYMDQTGTIRIQPQFESARGFKQGLAAVSLSGKYGFIDKSGRFVIAPQFTGVWDFDEFGMCPVCYDSAQQHWGYVDTLGTLVIDTLFSYAAGFSCGRALVGTGQQWTPEFRQNYINRAGDFITNEILKWGSPFDGGFAAVQFEKDYGIIDTSGNVVLRRDQWIQIPSEGLAVAAFGDKWGYVDIAGKTMIEPQFELTMRFSEGFAAVVKGGKVGFIDKKGEWAVKPAFDGAQPFREGLAAINVGGEFKNPGAFNTTGGKWGFINRQGDVVIEPRFTWAGSFKNGRAPVKVGGAVGRYGSILGGRSATIDTSGEITFPEPKIDGPMGLPEGTDLYVIQNSEGKKGYIDNLGRMVIEPKFSGARPFEEGFALVRTDDGYKYIDGNGNTFPNDALMDARPFSDGMAAVKRYCMGQCTWTYIDFSGDFVMPQYPAGFQNAWDFHNGIALVTGSDGSYLIDKAGMRIETPEALRKIGDVQWWGSIGEHRLLFKVAGKFGICDDLGKILVQPRFTQIGGFDDGRAPVTIGSKNGYIDPKGAVVIELKYESALGFSEGIAQVQLNGLWGYIDTSGIWIAEPQFKECDSFSEGLACVEIESKRGYIDRTGKLVIPARFEPPPTDNVGIPFFGFSQFKNGLARVRTIGEDGSYRSGYINKQGEFAIPPRFGMADPFDRKLTWAADDEQAGYINTKGEFVWTTASVRSGRGN